MQFARIKKLFSFDRAAAQLREAAPLVLLLIGLCALTSIAPDALAVPLKLLISSLFLYLLIFFSSPAAFVGAALLVCTSILICADPADALLRTLCAAMLLGFRRGKTALPPFISLFLAWGIYLIVVQLIPPLAEQVIGSGWLDVLILLLSELSLVSIFVVFSAYRTPRSEGGTREISGLNFFVHLNAGIFIFLCGAGALVLAIVDRNIFSLVLNYIDSAPNAVIIVLLPLFFAPVLSGVISAWVSLSLLSAIRSILVPQQAGVRTPIFITEQLLSTAEVDRTVARLRRTEEERRVFREEKTRLAEQIVSLGATLDADPRAVCVVDSELRLVAANARFVDQFSVVSDQIGSSSLEDIERFAPWLDEVSDELREMFAAGKVGGRHHTWTTSGRDGQYLMVKAVLAHGLYRASQRIEAVLAIEQRVDLRKTVSQIAAPRPGEHCAFAAVQRFGQLDQMIAKISSNLSRMGQVISNTLTFDPDGAAAVLERTLAFLTESEAEAKRAAAELAAFQERFSIDSLFDAAAPKSNFDIDAAMQMVLEFSRETVPGAPKLVLMHGDKEADENDSPYLISGPPMACALFTAYSATVIQLLSAQKADRAFGTVIKLDHENLTSEVSTFLPGSAAGRYVRLEIGRRGTRLRQDLLGDGQNVPAGAENQLESAVALLAHLVRTMGGFVSIQTSGHRGVTISVYLNASNERRPSLRRRRNSANIRRLLDRRANLRDILLLSPAKDGLSSLAEKLRGLGYDVCTERPDSVLRLFNRSMGVSGSGFGAVSEASEKAEPELDLDAFKLLVVDVAEASSSIIAVLEQLEEEYPEVARLLVSDQIAKNSAVERFGTPIPASIDDHLLAQAIDDLFELK